MVETAITMPLFVFIILGTIQLGLMHQARSMVKYAAYKAVRAGSIYHAKKSNMETAALMVLLPLTTGRNGGGLAGQEYQRKTSTAAEYVMAANLTPNLFGGTLKWVDATICYPNKNDTKPLTTTPGGGVSFDNPLTTATGGTWETFDRTKLVVQITFNYRMPIPFANMMFYHIVRGTETRPLQMITRTATKVTPFVTKHYGSAGDVTGQRDALAAAHGGYVMPIRATYAMRMQSDLYPDRSGFEVPAKNECYRGFKGE